MKTKRIQRSRKKGWRMPPSTISVSRPSKWGNPFKLFGDMIYIDASHRRKILSRWVYLCMGDAEKCVRLYHGVVTGIMQQGDYGFEFDKLPDIMFWVKHFRKLNIRELKGKNLACWCKDEPCHADVLLKLANKP